ncbi:putative methyltransferase TARBP1 [Bagarius yarrelli]|uniref:tRNA (guanosine(18)-2'-O)-methyltransferase TARBP1 n=1 Tax=Bagarius yarrelli TaxID=175774 RepID=A0A556UFY6_BAGYA|nr:putative methyltransferase TARBP1 [Bagarius yarrelli]
MLNAVCALLMACVPECQMEFLEKLAGVALPVLSEKEDRNDEPQLETDVAIEVLSVLISGLSCNSALRKKVLSCTLSSVKKLSDTWVSKIIVRIWFTCLNTSNKTLQADLLSYLYQDLLDWYKKEDTEVVTARLLLCLTALSDFIFSLDKSGPNVEMSRTFFKVVQNGLVHSDGMSRKRAVYLLNRCISLAMTRNTDVNMWDTDFFFKWTPRQRSVLQKFWDAFTLVLETLEEYQLHVIRPVLSRIDILVQTISNDTGGDGMIHPSWLLCVYQRMFQSENKTVVKEGVSHLLGLEMIQHPAFALAFSQFVVGPVMDVLAESSLYHRSPKQSIGECPELALKLQNFLVTFFSRLPEDQKGQADAGPVVGEAELLARSLLLSANLDWRRREMPNSEEMKLQQLFCPLLDVLYRLNTSVYLPLCKTNKSLELLLRLLLLLGKNAETRMENEDKMAVALKQLLLSVAEPVQEFILLKLSGELQTLSDIESANLYLSLLRELIRTYSKVPSYSSNLQKNYVSRLTRNCLRLLSEPSEQNPSIALQVQKAVSMATLAVLCDLADQCGFDSQSEAMKSLLSLTAYFFPSSSSLTKPQLFNQTLLKPSSTTDRGYDDPLLKDWSRVVAYFMRDQWTCLSFLQKLAETPEATEAFSAAVEALSLLPSDLVLPVLDFMCAALPKVLNNETLCVEAVSVSWRLVQSLSTNAHDFWLALPAFVCIAFHRSLLELEDVQSHKLATCIKQVTAELIELSQAKLGVFNVLIQHCCNTWLPPDPHKHSNTVFQTALNHMDILTEACVYGPAYRKDQRLQLEVQTYVEQLGEELSADTLINSWDRDDQFPRLRVLAFLSHLEPSNNLHQSLMENLVRCLLEKDKDITKAKVRYYNNSMQHRIKNRVWQILLLLLPKLRLEFVVDYVFGLVCEAGLGNNQPSVKYLIEWALILILYLNPSQIQHFWVCFSVDQEKTRTSICTFLSVLVHLGILLPKLDDKAKQWQKAIEVILLWCFSHNFTVRLYALLALKRVWGLEGARRLAEEDQQCRSSSLTGLGTVVEACLHQAEVMQNTGNAAKNWNRIQEHFFFSAFHPLDDYSIETIFHTLPVLSELAEDEWIPVWKFEKLIDFNHSSSVPLRNPGRELREVQPNDWIQQDKGELQQEELLADVQKKIAPWSLNVQEVEPHIMAQQRVSRLGKSTTSLVVVASLIDKPTNLGGLCRTCEIFGASALALGSLHHLGDKQFQALSVSSELWLPLIEVKPMDLTGFLQLRQKEGYSIIGVEQTANSQSLQNYRFPEKTLLLLGNEREGIPADLLQLLDVCVEIPQQGVTRSLNVHVSAALLVWEYTKQHSVYLMENLWLEASDHLLGENRFSWKNSTSPVSFSPRGKLLMEALMVLMCVGAVTGNILVIMIVVATKTFHSVTSVLIINLAISDFLVGIGVMPFVAISLIDNGWVNCTDLCLYVGYTSSVYCNASVLTLAAIALDRYYSIVDCLRYNSHCTAWRIGGAVLWIWLQAMLISCPPLLGWSNINFVNPMYSCAVNWASSPSYTVFMAALCFFLPATVILFCYAKIVRVAQHHAQRIHSLQQHFQHSRDHHSAFQSSHQCSSLDLEMHDPSQLVYYVTERFVSRSQLNILHSQENLRMAEEPTLRLKEKSSFKFAGQRLRTFFAHSQSGAALQKNYPHQHGIVRLFMVIAAFFLCWTPYIGVALVQATETALSRSVSKVPPAAVTFSYWLVLFNSDINPLLYALLSKRFQGALRNLRKKIQVRLGMDQKEEEGRTDGDVGRLGNPNNVISSVSNQYCQDNRANQNESVYSTVFKMNSPFYKSYKQDGNEVFLPGSMLSSSSFPTSSSSVSLCQKCRRNTPKNSDCLQVNTEPQGWDQIHSTPVIK